MPQAVVFKSSVLSGVAAPEHLISRLGHSGAKGVCNCNRAVFWTCEWFGVEGDLRGPARPMHCERNLKKAHVTKPHPSIFT